MGIADIIPGVSGGTIAFIFGIYEEFIRALKSIDLQFFKYLISLNFKEAFNHLNWKFLCVLGVGIVSAVFSMSHLMSWLLEHKAVHVHAFFFGLILATIPIIGKVIKKWSLITYVLIAISAIIMYFIVQQVPIETPNSLLFIFFCGAVAISAMILPGISGSFILLILGKYRYIVEAIKDRDLLVIFVFLCGIAVGIMIFVRILSWLFKRFHDTTLAVLTGIVLGSLVKIWPWKVITKTLDLGRGKIVPIEVINVYPETFNISVGISISLMITGFLLAMYMNSMNGAKQINLD